MFKEKIERMNFMKKLLLLTIALVMTLSLAGCGRDAVTMVDVATEQGISMKLPSDMTKQEGNPPYLNTKTGDSVTYGVAEVGGTPLSTLEEENVLATYQSKHEDVVVQSFENGLEINGKEALVSVVTLKTPKGSDLTSTLVMVTDGTQNYVVTFNYGSDNTDGSLAQNIQACVDSITIK